MRIIATQDAGLIEYVLKSNHRNYHKSRIQTEYLGKFLGKGLLTVNGDYWLKQRRLIQPGFHTEKIHALYGIMKSTIDEFLLTVPTGDVDVYPLMHKLAFDIQPQATIDGKQHATYRPRNRSEFSNHNHCLNHKKKENHLA